MLAVLVGSLLRRNEVLEEIRVEDLVYVAQAATHGSVSYNPQDIIKLQAHILPLVVLGTLHSHPGCPPHISKEDLDSAERGGETLFGIYSYWQAGAKRRSSLDWYYGAQRLKP